MSKSKIIVGLTVLIGLGIWLSIRPASRAISAPPTITYDAFTEENAAHRFATSQTRHWRHHLINK